MAKAVGREASERRAARRARTRWIILGVTLVVLVVVLAILYRRGALAPSPEEFPRFEQVPLLELPERAREEKLDETLRAALDAEPPPTEPLTILIDLRDQVDFDGLSTLMDEAGIDEKLERRRIVIKALAAVAGSRARRIEPYLDELAGKDLVLARRGFSIVNRVLVRCRPRAVRMLAARTEVQSIMLDPGRVADHVFATHGRGDPEQLATDGVAPRSWAIGALKMPEAWASGADGAGVVVGILDTGVDGGHAQLAPGYRGGDDSWYDAVNGTETPTDHGTHGTAVLSCAVGRNAGGAAIGVAPGASWVAAAVFADERPSYGRLTAGADWLLNEARPDVIVNAWSFRPDGLAPDPQMGHMISAWRAAEMVVVFSAGNTGPTAGRDPEPMSLTGHYPPGLPVLSVGATRRDGSIWGLSARGPNPKDGGLYPQIAAPGEDVTVAHAHTRDGLGRASGTSYAAGYVAGAAALIIERAPQLRAKDVELMLARTADDAGAAGDDNDFGHGLLDAVEAVR